MPRLWYSRSFHMRLPPVNFAVPWIYESALDPVPVPPVVSSTSSSASKDHRWRSFPPRFRVVSPAPRLIRVYV
jgi:hypothetical protein